MSDPPQHAMDDIAGLMTTWVADGLHPYQASHAWGYWWGCGLRTAPSVWDFLGFLLAMLLGAFDGLIRRTGK